MADPRGREERGERALDGAGAHVVLVLDDRAADAGRLRELGLRGEIHAVGASGGGDRESRAQVEEHVAHLADADAVFSDRRAVLPAAAQIRAHLDELDAAAPHDLRHHLLPAGGLVLAVALAWRGHRHEERSRAELLKQRRLREGVTPAAERRDDDTLVGDRCQLSCRRAGFDELDLTGGSRPTHQRRDGRCSGVAQSHPELGFARREANREDDAHGREQGPLGVEADQPDSPPKRFRHRG